MKRWGTSLTLRPASDGIRKSSPREGTDQTPRLRKRHCRQKCCHLSHPATRQSKTRQLVGHCRLSDLRSTNNAHDWVTGQQCDNGRLVFFPVYHEKMIHEISVMSTEISMCRRRPPSANGRSRVSPHGSMRTPTKGGRSNVKSRMLNASRPPFVQRLPPSSQLESVRSNEEVMCAFQSAQTLSPSRPDRSAGAGRSSAPDQATFPAIARPSLKSEELRTGQ
jgi:hypothetical protein